MSFAQWSMDEDDILRKLYGKSSYRDMCLVLPTRTPEAIKTRCYVIGLKNTRGTMVDAKRDNVYMEKCWREIHD